MLPVNSKITYRTNGRGVARVWKGVVFAIVKAGKLPVSKALQASVPHGDKPSNRDRYIVKIDKIGTLAWANVRTTVEAGAKLPKTAPKVKAKPVVKVKAKVKVKPVAKVKTPPKVVKADKPKTTWYGLVDGKVVSVRKVICPEGFKAAKAALVIPALPQPVPTPTPEPAALPQAAV